MKLKRELFARAPLTPPDGTWRSSMPGFCVEHLLRCYAVDLSEQDMADLAASYATLNGG
jgi:hypothetical protein